MPGSLAVCGLRDTDNKTSRASLEIFSAGLPPGLVFLNLLVTTRNPFNAEESHYRAAMQQQSRRVVQLTTPAWLSLLA